MLAAAWRQALRGAPGCFADIAGHPATVQALVAAHAELRDLTPAALARIAATNQVAADLARLHLAVRDALCPSWYDPVDALGAAAQEAADAARAGHGALVLYLPQALSQAEARFVTALASGCDLQVIAGLTGASRADEGVRRSLRLLGAAAAGVTPVATAARVLTASDSDDEVRCVVREIVAALATTPAHRIAVLYSAAQPYARLLHEQLAAAKITVNGAGSRPVDERAVARTFLELIALAEGDVPRAGLFRALAGGPVRDFSGGRIPVARWERISRAAGVVSGEDWTVRLGDYIRAQRSAADTERGAGDPQPGRVLRLEASAAAAAALLDFTTRLRAALSRGQQLATWAGLAEWSAELFGALVGPGRAEQTWPAAEQYAAAAVASMRERLAGLGAVEPVASLGMLREVLAAELAGSLPRVGRFGDGVFVGPLSAAAGLELDAVFVVGLSEDLYPGRLRADALLPERVRNASHGELPSGRERLHEQYRDLLAALSVARHAVASFPRGDLRRSTRRLPSRWLLPSLRELAGDTRLAATQWQRADYGGKLSSAGSFGGELTTATRLSTEQEWRTRQAAAGRLDDPIASAAADMISARTGASFTRYDGNLAGAAGLPDYAAGERPISPTGLEKFAGCPHAFFVERLLGVQPVEQPEDIIQISAKDIGSLMHESLDQLVRACGDQLPGYGEPWTPAQREQLRQIVTGTAREYQRRGLTGHARLWEPECARIAADMDRLLDDDDQWRAGVGARVRASEMPFGLRGKPPVAVAVPGGRVLMRGSADKIDVDAAGKIYVTDLKTGSRTPFDVIKRDPLAGGTKLQLPVYAYAARARYGAPGTSVHAAYWFVRRDHDRIGVDLTPELAADYARAIGVLAGAIAAGLFPPRPPDKPDFGFVQCPYCNPDSIGHAAGRERWERKRSDPALAGLVALIEPAGAR